MTNNSFLFSCSSSFRFWFYRHTSPFIITIFLIYYFFLFFFCNFLLFKLLGNLLNLILFLLILLLLILFIFWWILPIRSFFLNFWIFFFFLISNSFLFRWLINRLKSRNFILNLLCWLWFFILLFSLFFQYFLHFLHNVSFPFNLLSILTVSYMLINLCIWYDMQKIIRTISKILLQFILILTSLWNVIEQSRLWHLMWCIIWTSNLEVMSFITCFKTHFYL